MYFILLGCASYETRCASGLCISKQLIQDGETQCWDMADECTDTIMPAFSDPNSPRFTGTSLNNSQSMAQQNHMPHGPNTSYVYSDMDVVNTSTLWSSGNIIKYWYIYTFRNNITNLI